MKKNAGKKKIRSSHLMRGLGIFASLVAIISSDQITKKIAKQNLEFYKPHSYWGDLFRLQYSENPGAFLSLGAGLPESWRFWIFSVVIPLCLIATAVFLFYRKMDWLSTVGLTLVVGGGLGNMIDRILYGRVVDFMNIGIGSLRTGIFNVADFAIMIGVGILTLESFKNPAAPAQARSR